MWRLLDSAASPVAPSRIIITHRAGSHTVLALRMYTHFRQSGFSRITCVPNGRAPLLVLWTISADLSLYKMIIVVVGKRRCIISLNVD